MNDNPLIDNDVEFVHTENNYRKGSTINQTKMESTKEITSYQE